VELGRDVELSDREDAMRATVHLSQPISDADLQRVSRDNPGWQVERDPDGSLLMSPTSSAGSKKNAELTLQLGIFAKRFGGEVFDSDGGFTLPDGSVLSANGAWIETVRWTAVPAELRDTYAPIVPDVWIELRSRTDRVAQLQAKLGLVKSFGARYVLLIDPYDRTTWSQGAPPENLALDLEAIYDA
jgi:Uma2 family endonuclease